MPNLQAKISAHNKSILSGTTIIQKGCNCQKNRVCPLKGQCIVSDCVYMATVISKNEQQEDGHRYVGLCTGLFKLRLSNHDQSFKDRSKMKASELSKFIWKIKDSPVNEFSITWKILGTEKTYNRNNGKCQLCLREKLEILKSRIKSGRKSINKREEIFRGCLHRFRHQLGNIDIRNVQMDLSSPVNLSVKENIESGSLRSGKQWKIFENG